MEILFSKPEHVLTITRNLLLLADADLCDLFIVKDRIPELITTASRRGDVVDFVDQLEPSARTRPREIVIEVSRSQQVLCRGFSPGTKSLASNDQAHMVQGGPCLCMPVIDGKNLIGVCYFERSTKHQIFDPELVKLLTLLIEQLAEYLILNRLLFSERILLRTIIDVIPDLVFVKDTDGRFVAANVAVSECFGLASPAQLIGKSDFDFFPAEKVALLNFEWVKRHVG